MPIIKPSLILKEGLALPENDAVEKLILRLVEKIVAEARREAKSKGKPGLEVKEVLTTSPHGIYYYVPEKDVWRLEVVDGEAFTPKNDGFYVVYFDNARCPACRVYDLYWFPWVREVSRKYKDTFFIIVLCSWFARECSSTAASSTFKHWNVRASPTTLFLYVKSGKIVMDSKREGVMDRDKLNTTYTLFRELAQKCKP